MFICHPRNPVQFVGKKAGWALQKLKSHKKEKSKGYIKIFVALMIAWEDVY
jgi:hypothetical protein